MNSGKVELLDDKRLLAQLSGLERRTSRAGKNSIDDSLGAHDDLANSAAGALLLASESDSVPEHILPPGDILRTRHRMRLIAVAGQPLAAFGRRSRWRP